jgi:hypothetical protein
MQLQPTLNKINPYQLFLVDGVGALLSALMLSLVLARFENTFGISKDVLYLLSLAPFLFCIYSLMCFSIRIRNWRNYLKIIAIANLLYCCYTLFLLFDLSATLTFWGFLYFFLEIVVVVLLAMFEIKVAFHVGKN